MSIRLFISFSSDDHAQVRELAGQLRLQEMDVWNYSDIQQDIKAGQDVVTELERKIDESDYFILVLSKSSIVSEYVTIETRYAIKRGIIDTNRIIPVMIDKLVVGKLPEPFSTIAHLKHLPIDSSDDLSLIQTVHAICLSVGREFLPPLEAHPRLPFWREFRRELTGMAYPSHSYGYLMEIIGLFMMQLKEDNIADALGSISHFVSTVKFSMKNVTLFYPQIVMGMCQRMLGQSKGAERTYREVIEKYPKKENGYSGLGGALFDQERFEESLACYEEARDLANNHPDERTNCIIVNLELRRLPTREDEAFLLTLPIDKFDEEARIRITNAQAMLHFRKAESFEKQGNAAQSRHEYEMVIDVLSPLLQKEFYNITTVGYLQQSLAAINRVGEAEKILEQAITGSNGNPLLRSAHYLHHWLSEIYMMQGMNDKALEQYEKHLLTSTERKRLYHIKYARINKHLGRSSVMAKTCQKVLDNTIFPTPETPADFYYDGFANYLLGNHERAQYDFERSRGHGNRYETHE